MVSIKTLHFESLLIYGQNIPISNATYIIFITWFLQEPHVYIRCNVQKGLTQNIIDMPVEAMILPETKICKV